MMSYAPMPKDPYADLLRPTPPRDRRRHPLDASEPYVARFTTAPIRQNPRTGSYEYRHGLLNDGSMTAKQRQFEEYVNEQQARQDELSDLKEWRRLKDLEEEAIALYHDLDENLEEYTAQMRTRDQMEMELQCGRNKQIEKDLSVNTQRAVAAARSIPFAMEQERIKATKAKVQADFKAGVEASMANTKISINATGSQQASKQSEVTQSKPKKHRKTSQSVSSTEAGSPKQQQEKTKPSSEEICDQLQDQAPNKSQSPSATIDQLTSSGTPVGTSSSKQQEEKKQPSAEEIRCQFAEQVQKRLAEAGLLRSAAPLRHQERKNELSPEGVCNKPQAPLQAQPAALTRMPPITKTVRPVPSQSAASAPLRHLGNGVIFGPNCWTGPSTGYQQQTRLNYGVHYSEGSVLVRKETGLTKAFLGCSSQAEQSLAHNIHQSPDTPPEHRVITSTERSPERISPHQSSNSTSSNKSSDSASPDKSSDSTSPDQSPDSTSLEKSPDSASPYQAPDARYTPPPSAGPSAPRTQTVQTMPIVNSFNTLGIWARNGDQSGPSPPRTSVQPIVPVYHPPDNSRRLPRFEWVPYRSALSRLQLQGFKSRPSIWDDPANDLFRRKEMRKEPSRQQRFHEWQKWRRSKCNQGGPSQQERTEQELKMKLASERKWEALDEMCWKTCLEDEKKAQQKGMSSQDFIELCKKKRGSQDETSQQEGTSSQEGLSQHGTSQQEDPCRRATENQT